MLRAVFRKDGEVTNIKFQETRPAKPEGYTEAEIEELINRAVEAAHQIRFIPATKDGKPVSMWMELQYAFKDQAKDKAEDKDKNKDKPSDPR